MLIRSRVLRIFALASAIVGLVIFIALYFRNVEGRLEEALHEPQTIALVLLPFLPAVILSFMAERARTKFIDFLQKEVMGGDLSANPQPEKKDK